MKQINLPLKAVLVAGALSLFPQLSKAQYFWDAGISAGVSNYLGEMGGNELPRRDFVSDMKLPQTRTYADGFVRYKISPVFSVKANLGWARIQGDDKLSTNPGRNGRNLSFRNDVIESTAQLQYFFYDIYDLGHTYRYANSFRAYIGIGAGAAYHNPKTMHNGEWVKLRPLMTEGYRYTTVTAVIPASAGFYFTFKKKYRLGWDLTWRTTFTDYLDDVSTVYADPAKLPSALSAELANRTDELPVSAGFAENYTPGNKRGDPSHKDSYLSTSVDFSYVFRGQSSTTRAQHTWIDQRNHPDRLNGPVQRRTGILKRKIRVHW
jgi:hypothetical protein